MFIQALVASYRDGCELVAFCDTNETRMNFYNRAITATFAFFSTGYGSRVFHVQRIRPWIEVAIGAPIANEKNNV